MIEGRVIEGTVRIWHDEEGWGVIDSPETPGGCWAHFSDIDAPGYRSLTAGQLVELEWESFRQDGYDHRATLVRVPGTPPREDPPDRGPSSAYRSSLTVTWDDPPR